MHPEGWHDWSQTGGPVMAQGSACLMSADSANLQTGRAPQGWPGNLAPPEAMSAADAKDASELAGVLEEYVLRCLFSKNWQLREAALQYIERQLSGDVSVSTHLTKLACSDRAAMDSPVDTSILADPVGRAPCTSWSVQAGGVHLRGSMRQYGHVAGHSREFQWPCRR